MFKVLLWDYTGISSEWCKKFLDMTDVEIVHTITPAETAPEILLRRDVWDWLLIFEQGARQFFDAALQLLKLPPDRVIYAFDIDSWLQRPKAFFAILNDMEELRKHFLLNEIRKLNVFATCTVEGMSYVSPSADMRVPHMFISGSNWASRDMKRFHALAKQYYGIDDGAGYFLDLGANIGTTGIYFTKKLAPNLKLLAFEPDPENFKMHRINLMLNDIGDDKATVVNCGLGDKADELKMYRNLENPGANSFIKQDSGTPIAPVKIIPLDDYLAEHNIAARDVKYIWIDTEGFEAQVLLGAKNLLRENPAPLFVECNLGAWDKSGYFDDMMTLLAEGYSHFILFEGKQTLYPLETLRTLKRSNTFFGRRGDIFLIRKGAVV